MRLNTYTERRITEAFEERPKLVCDDAGIYPPLVAVRYWVADGKGVALQTPLRGQEWSATLTFFTGGWNGGRALAGNLEKCDKKWKVKADL